MIFHPVCEGPGLPQDSVLHNTDTDVHTTFKDDIVDTQTLRDVHHMFRERDEFVSKLHPLLKRDKSKKKPN